MKYILTLLMLISIAYGQNITNLQLKGGTVKLIVAALRTNVTSDTSVRNMFQKWREDYIDGTVPNDNANVTISTTKTANVVLIYELLLRLPAGLISTNNFITDFTTSIAPKRATDAALDAACTALETRFANEYNTLLSVGLGDLQAK
jgi:hypothetical protein